MKLPDETVITTSRDNSITLTDKRIFKKQDKDFTSINLDKISCIKVKYSSAIAMLAIGIILLILGVLAIPFTNSHELIIPIAGSVLGIILIALFFATRKHSISIISDSGESIGLITKGLKSEEILTFINKIDEAKINFKMISII